MSQDPIQCLLAQAYQPARCEGGLSCVLSEVPEVISPRTSSGEDPFCQSKAPPSCESCNYFSLHSSSFLPPCLTVDCSISAKQNGST